VAAASRQGSGSRKRCRCWVGVEDGRLPFGCEPNFDFRPRAPP
jgi:hypothetical protein